MSFKTISLSIALSALGVAACTITSGTVDDTGVRNTGPDIPVDSGDTDAGSDAAGDTNLACTTNPQASQGVTSIVSAGCQQCLDTNCCTQLTTCFAKTDFDHDLSGDCKELKECYDTTCATAPDKATCIAGCDSGNPGVTNEWAAVRSCGTSACATECAGINGN